MMAMLPDMRKNDERIQLDHMLAGESQMNDLKKRDKGKGINVVQSGTRMRKLKGNEKGICPEMVIEED